jgi:hypothetical protein
MGRRLADDPTALRRSAFTNLTLQRTAADNPRAGVNDMRTRFMMMAALVGASSLAISAQTPQSRPQPPQRPTETARPADDAQRTSQAQVITVTGCLKAEKDVPGRRPNAAERAGVTEDYILTSVKMAQSSATSGIGLAAMYEIEGIAEAELQKHLNHQVEITGSLTTGGAMGNRGASAAPGSQATTNADLPQLTATSVKMLAATCPAP